VDTGARNSLVAGHSAPAAPSPTEERATNNGPRSATELASREERSPPQPRLPTKEEAERQIREEAEKLRADRLAQVENRIATQRSQRIADQLKFREELREVVNSFGNRAGPEIDKLAKHYAGDINPVNWAKAHQKWRFERGLTQWAKVKYIRELELPEVVILDFLSDDMHALVKKRNGPRNESEVRVRAASQLLNYPFPGTDTTSNDGGAGRDTQSARTQASSSINGAARP
jgi:hypothetical protein